jgi:hypothetical protein
LAEYFLFLQGLLFIWIAALTPAMTGKDCHCEPLAARQSIFIYLSKQDL